MQLSIYFLCLMPLSMLDFLSFFPKMLFFFVLLVVKG